MSNPSSQLYQYKPSEVAAIIFLSLFALTTAIHVGQMWRGRNWFFVAFVIGGFFEWIGYAARLINTLETPPHWNLGAFIVQDLLILLAPAFFSASIYMFLARVIRNTKMQRISPINDKLLTKIFIFGDFMSFSTQSTGGSLLAGGGSGGSTNSPKKHNSNPQDTKKAAQYIIIGGLFIQLIFFGGFIVCTAIFHKRINKETPPSSQQRSFAAWKRSLWTLYIVSAFIFVRSIFRVVEYAMGQQGYILEHEVFLYVFDSALMFLTMAVLNIGHPVHFPKHNTSENVTNDVESKLPLAVGNSDDSNGRDQHTYY